MTELCQRQAFPHKHRGQTALSFAPYADDSGIFDSLRTSTLTDIFIPSMRRARETEITGVDLDIAGVVDGLSAEGKVVGHSCGIGPSESNHFDIVISRRCTGIFVSHRFGGPDVGAGF